MNLLHPHTSRLWSRWRLATLACMAFGLTAVSTAVAQPPALEQESNRQGGQSIGTLSQDTDENGVDYLTHGPLHEAFAEPYEAEPAASAVVPEKPPEPIDEVPPEYRPEGEDVEWISGYWAWDEQREDFIWVSGIWRDVPPGQRWIPGYWEQSEGGYRWISGFWTSNDTTELRYLPVPPDSLEQGPSSQRPGEEYFYVPGMWVYEANEYQWRPGYWARGYDDWIWVPAEYVWTPRGCVYRAGYWDYDVAYRGIVFTPVYYRQPLYQGANYFYRPRYTVDTGLTLLVHLFVHPGHRHYYFGDYYGSRYQGQYYAWAHRYRQPTYYDPLFAYYDYRSRGSQINVLSWVTERYQYFESNERYRPPRTIQAQRQFVRTNTGPNVNATVLRLAAVGEDFSNLVRQEDAAGRFRPVDEQLVQQYREEQNSLRQLVQRRRQAEVGDGQVQAEQRSSDETGRADANQDPGEDRDTDARDDRRDRKDRNRPDAQRDVEQSAADGEQRRAARREGEGDEGFGRGGFRLPALERARQRLPQPDDTDLQPGRAEQPGETDRSDRVRRGQPPMEQQREQEAARQRPERTDQPSGRAEQPSETDRSDRVRRGQTPMEQQREQEAARQRPERTDQPSGRTDQPSGRTDQPPGRAEQPPGRTDQPPGRAEQRSEQGESLRGRLGTQPDAPSRMRPFRPDDWPAIRQRAERSRSMPPRPEMDQGSSTPDAPGRTDDLRPRSPANVQPPGRGRGAEQSERRSNSRPERGNRGRSAPPVEEEQNEDPAGEGNK